MAFAGLKAMLVQAVQDRIATVVVLLAGGLILLTAWGLAVASVVLALARLLGMVGALLAVSASLVVVAVLLIWMTAARNRRTAAMRATTRALWTATAVNAASAILRGEPHGPEAASETGGRSHRSMLLIAGGLALILLALLMPGGSDKGHDGPDSPG